MSHPEYSEDQLSRFWSKVQKQTADGGCWMWTGAKNSHGYGQVRINYKLIMAHRLAYELLVGPIPAGLHIDHLCRTPGCVNPGHLEPVTPRENILRGVAPAAMYAKRTSCPLGHPLSGENLGFHGGARRCLRCHNIKERARYRRKRCA